MSSVVDKVWATLEPLTDPEIPVVTLRELGILRDVRETPTASRSSSPRPTAAAPPWGRSRTTCGRAWNRPASRRG
jgi:hypothetical protein